MSAEKETFAEGDIVELKSGGPKMTCTGKPKMTRPGAPIMTHAGEADAENVTCQWFAGKKLEWGSFRPGTLKKVPEGDTPAK